MPAQPVVAAHLQPAPYGVLLIPSALQAAPAKADLLMPLTLTYLLSMHLPFYFPVGADCVAQVESAFDEILSGHSLTSKGIVYRPVTSRAELSEVLNRATLVLTVPPGVKELTQVPGKPCAVLEQVDGKGYSMRLRNVEAVTDEDLKAKLVGCAQLINIQSGGFISEGHFSLSW